MKLFQQAVVLMTMASMTTAQKWWWPWWKPKIDSERLQRDIKSENLMANLQRLHDIAYANGGNRAFGLPGYKASVDFIWEHVSKVRGTTAWIQDFEALFSFVENIQLTIDGEEIYVFGLTYSPSTSEEGISAEVVLGPEAEAGCDVSSYEGIDVEGKIVLVDRFACPDGSTLAGRVRPAAAAGAAAVIVYNFIESNVTAGTLSRPDPEGFVPAGFINQVDGLRIREVLEGGATLDGYFQQTQLIENRTTQNVFVETDDGDPDNIIILGAHLDSVQAGPGINDDGSGSSLILELFDAVIKYRTRTKLRFAWWGAEENGLLGSRHYVNNLSADEVNSILLYLNFDMVSRGFWGVADGDGSEFGVVGPEGSEVIEQIWLDWFADQGLETTPTGLGSGSDYAPFWQVLNKPFGFLFTGTGIEQDPCYHQPCDTYDNAVPETIHTNARAAAHALTVLSLDGPELIPKFSVDETALRTRGAGPDLAVRSLEFVDQSHLGCAHEDEL